MPYTPQQTPGFLCESPNKTRIVEVVLFSNPDSLPPGPESSFKAKSFRDVEFGFFKMAFIFFLSFRPPPKLLFAFLLLLLSLLCFLSESPSLLTL